MGSILPKSDFIGVEDVAHLCAGGETPFLKRNVDALLRFSLDKSRGMPGRANHFAVYAEAKQRFARLLHIEPGDIALLGSASDGINVAALAIAWRPGDNVVVEAIEYPSVIYPWARARGVDVRVVPTRAGDADLDALAAAMDDRTRVLATSHVSYYSGVRHDLPALRALADRVGARLIVDVSHALGVVPVRADLCDLAVSCCYKWILGAHGLGICAWNRHRWPDLDSALVGWASVASRGGPADRTAYTLKPDAARLELGNPAFPSVYVTSSGADYLLAAGIERIEAHVLRLGERLRDGLLALGLPVLTPAPAARRAGNYCFATDEGPRLQAALFQRGVLVWEGEGRVRISVHGYNDDDDVDRCLTALGAVLASGR
ncbi:MAG: aminotransferase class V-fold PLP-dependent enzyme [Chloroflexi bacterium]|nr:aminotransferase class V-fold PLP-dependent enzyme [Chloroflexota bacterium]